jgi:DNA invertase Pin-like site-specific DNA recombinase
MSESKYVIALYLRLSQEDDGYGESESIANQRELLNSFVASNREFDNARILEFSDDGYTGTNFNRPGVTEMLELVKNGVVNCVIVKDFSRFGRSFIEVGDYIEQIFPFLGVRFITVNNYFDSNNHMTSVGTLDIALKNLINDLYSKDISKKVRSAKQTKMAKGDFMSTGALFGYSKSAKNKNQLVIDPVAADYVRRIFTLCMKGNSTTNIAFTLNIENIPTPLVYKRSIGKERKWNIIGDENIWTRAGIVRTLRDERYTGKMISGKRIKPKVGQKQSVKVQRQDWYVVDGSHEPIISQADFDKVQEILGYKQEKNGNKEKQWLFSKKIYCGHCRHALRRRDREPAHFFCDTPKYTHSKCTKQKIFETKISEIILHMIKKYAEIALCAESVFMSMKKKTDKDAVVLLAEIEMLKGELSKLNQNKIMLYEKYKDGSLTKEAYLTERDIQAEKISQHVSRMEHKESELINSMDKTNENRFVKNFKDLSTIIQLTPELVDALVSAIYVYGTDEIEVAWNFEDEFLKAVDVINNRF